MGKSDMHIHSLEGSIDAFLPIKKIIYLLNVFNINDAAITDHDGFRAVTSLAKEYGIPLKNFCYTFGNVRIYPGAEFRAYVNTSSRSCKYSMADNDTITASSSGNQYPSVHIIALCPTPDSCKITADLFDTYTRYSRLSNYPVLDILNNELRFNITPQDIATYKYLAGKKSLADKDYIDLVKKLYPNEISSDMEEELKEVFGDLKRPKSLILSAKQVIDAIHMAGGLALLAHPNFTFKKKSQTETWLIINTLKELGLDGYVSDIKDENGVKVFQDLNSTQSMVRVAGSDFHNLVSNLHLGTLLNSSESVKFSKNILSERDYNILTDTLKSNYNYRNKRRKFHIDQNLILRATAIMGEQNEVYGDNVNMMHDKLNNFTKNDYYTEIRQYAWHSIKQTWEDFNKYFVLDENAVKPEYNRKRMLSNMNRHFLKYMNARLADIDTIYFLPELFHTKVMPNYDPYKDIPDWTPDTVIDPKNKQKVVKILDGVKKSYNELHS